MIRRYPARILVLLALVTLAGTLSACNNLWGWTADSGSFDALLADGREAIRAADYALAREKFAQAVQLRPAHAEARYYLAKAVVLDAEVDVFSLVQTLTETGPAARGATEIFAFDLGTANSIYGVNGFVIETLQPVSDGLAVEGDFAELDVDLDLAIAYTLRGILRLRDTNGDGVIDENDLSLDDFGLGDDGEFSLAGLDSIPPEDLNDMIDDLNDLLDSGGDLLLDSLGDSGIDVDELNDLINSLGGDLSAFYVNTGEPGNPGEGDNDADGLVDEECLNGIDDDADGLVDEDSRILGCP